MHGAMGGGTNGAGHVNMGLPYKAYNAEQVSAMQVMVVGLVRMLTHAERLAGPEANQGGGQGGLGRGAAPQ